MGKFINISKKILIENDYPDDDPNTPDVIEGSDKDDIGEMIKSKQAEKELANVESDDLVSETRSFIKSVLIEDTSTSNQDDTTSQIKNMPENKKMTFIKTYLNKILPDSCRSLIPTIIRIISDKRSFKIFYNRLKEYYDRSSNDLQKTNESNHSFNKSLIKNDEIKMILEDDGVIDDAKNFIDTNVTQPINSYVDSTIPRVSDKEVTEAADILKKKISREVLKSVLGLIAISPVGWVIGINDRVIRPALQWWVDKTTLPWEKQEKQAKEKEYKQLKQLQQDQKNKLNDYQDTKAWKSYLAGKNQRYKKYKEKYEHLITVGASKDEIDALYQEYTDNEKKIKNNALKQANEEFGNYQYNKYEKDVSGKKYTAIKMEILKKLNQELYHDKELPQEDKDLETNVYIKQYKTQRKESITELINRIEKENLNDNVIRELYTRFMKNDEDNFKNAIESAKTNSPTTETPPADSSNSSSTETPPADSSSDSSTNNTNNNGGFLSYLGNLVNQWKNFMNSDSAKNIINGAKDLKNQAGAWSNNNPSAAMAASAIALYALWKKFKNRSRGFSESIEHEMETNSLIMESFDIMDKLKYDDTISESSTKGFNSKMALTNKLTDNAKRLIAFAIREKDMPDEIKNEIQEAFYGNTFKSSNIINVSESAQLNVPKKRIDIKAFQESKLCNDTVAYLERNKIYCRKLLQENSFKAIDSYVMWKAAERFGKNPEATVADLKNDLIKFGGFDPIAESINLAKTIDKYENSPNRTLLTENKIRNNMKAEIMTYQQRMDDFVSKCVAEGNIPVYVMNNFKAYLNSINEDDNNIEIAGTTNNASTTSADSTTNTASTANANGPKINSPQDVANMISTGRDMAEKMANDPNVPLALKNKANELKNKIDENAKNNNSNGEPSKELSFQDPRIQKVVREQLKVGNDAIKSLKDSGKDMNAVWKNVQIAIPEIKGKSYSQLQREFRNGKISIKLMDRVNKNLISQ